jgi:uncharacterized protein (TIGR03000 family)
MFKPMSFFASVAILAGMVLVTAQGTSQAQGSSGAQGGAGGQGTTGQGTTGQGTTGQGTTGQGTTGQGTTGSKGYTGGGGTPYYGGFYGNQPYGSYRGSPYQSGYYPYGSYAPNGYYGYSTPYYYSSSGYYTPGMGSMPTMSSYQSFYPPMSQPGMGGSGQGNGTAFIEIMVPAQAQITFDGTMTQQTGPVRFYSTPPITGNSTYEVTATWKDQTGNDVRRTRTVHVAPNQQTFVNFMDHQAQDANETKDNRDTNKDKINKDGK